MDEARQNRHCLSAGLAINHTGDIVSLLSAQGVSIEQISQLVGHKSTQVTETVYRHKLRPVLTEGAEAMDGILPRNR